MKVPLFASTEILALRVRRPDAYVSVSSTWSDTGHNLGCACVDQWVTDTESDNTLSEPT